MSITQIAIYGAGGFAREVAWLVETCKEAGMPYETVCLVDDDERGQGQSLNGVPILGLERARQAFPHARIVGGIGSPELREKVMQRAAAAGFETATIIHPSVQRSRWIDVGEGTVICAGNILTTNIRLGRHVQINLACTIGHDAILDDYATLAPGVHVSGWVHIGKQAYVGTGANIINGSADRPLTIGDGAVIGAGACVVKPVEPGQTVVGVPAKPR